MDGEQTGAPHHPDGEAGEAAPAHAPGGTVRELADGYVSRLAEIDTLVATGLGLVPGDDRVPDLSPAGQDAHDELAHATLAALPGAREDGADDRRARRLLQERLQAQLAVSAAGEHLRTMRNVFGPHQQVRQLFLMMPTARAEDWGAVARRMARVPQAFAGYRQSLAEGSRQGLHAAPRQVGTVVDQLGDWLTGDGGDDGTAAPSWFHRFTTGVAGAAGAAGAAGVPASLRADLDAAATAAAVATAELRDWLAAEYLPAAAGTPDAVGADRYALGARLATGADLDLEEAYAWGWAEYRRLDEQMHAEAERVLPGAGPAAAMRHLDAEGEAVEGVEAVRSWLQQMMDTAITDLDGSQFAIEGPVRTVEAMIAPAGSAAAPYYTRPTLDFSRPGRTWLPTLGRTRFPLWDLVSTWYHEGVPGHHLQLARWTQLAGSLSTYQTSVGSVSATTEGWALYAERLMDELGYLTAQGARLGYLDAQQMRAVRVVVDIGMHLRLRVPADSPLHAGQVWTPEVAREFFGAHSGRDAAFLDSEIVRYLGWPGQAISYKLGERAWLAGRDAARERHERDGRRFDLPAWHAEALSLGSLGLDDLTDELAHLPR